MRVTRSASFEKPSPNGEGICGGGFWGWVGSFLKREIKPKLRAAVWGYRVTVGKIGFKKQELRITVAAGETTNLNIELERN